MCVWFSPQFNRLKTLFRSVPCAQDGVTEKLKDRSQDLSGHLD